MKKYLLLLAAGAIALPGLAIADAHGYSQGISGNVRINHEQNTYDEVTTSSTGTGGGDSYLQWNHNYDPSETKSVTGFVRFESSGDRRINVTGSASEGAWTASAKAEWDQNGVSGVTSERDQYVKAAHESGFNVQFGRAPYLDVKAGTFASWSGTVGNGSGADDGFADALESRFNVIKLGYDMGNGAAVSLSLQMDNTGNNGTETDNSSGALFGFVDGSEGSTPLSDTGDINGNIMGATYSGMGVDAFVNLGSGSVEGNKDRAAADDGITVDASFTQLGVSYDAGVAVPYLNMVSYLVEPNDDGDATDDDYSATMIGVSAAAANGTVMLSITNTTQNDDSASGTELGYVTSLGGAAFKAAYGTGSTDPDVGDGVDSSYIGLRMEYGF